MPAKNDKPRQTIATICLKTFTIICSLICIVAVPTIAVLWFWWTWSYVHTTGIAIAVMMSIFGLLFICFLVFLDSLLITNFKGHWREIDLLWGKFDA